MKNRMICSSTIILTLSLSPIDRTEASLIAPILNDYVWAARACSMPSVAPPEEVDIDDPDATGNTIRLRSLVDTDGDGVCEIYDVLPEEQSAFTGKIYGYPLRITKFDNGNWHTLQGSGGGWIPLVLEDRKSRARVLVELNYSGHAGHDTRVGFMRTKSDCERERLVIAASALLLSAPPAELQTDPALSDAWTGGVRYVVNERLIGDRLRTPYTGALADCMAPFKEVLSFLKLQ